MAIARRIMAEAARYGIAKRDLVMDALTMTVSTGERNALVTLETLRRCREERDAEFPHVSRLLASAQEPVQTDGKPEI